MIKPNRRFQFAQALAKQKAKRDKRPKPSTNNNNAERLQEWVGFALAPDSLAIRKLLLLTGHGINRGTIVTTMTHLFGDYAIVCPTLSDLAADQANIIQQARQFGKRSLIVSDASLPKSTTERSTLLRALRTIFECTNLAIVLSIDETLVRFDDANFRDHVLLVCTGYKPRLLESATIIAELSGILNWAIEGRKRLIAQGKFSC